MPNPLGLTNPTQISPTAAAAATQRLFNVKSYGAVGDGATDDHVAIQAAITAAGAAGGGIVFFPAATYYCGTTGLSMSTSNVVLRGEGGFASTISWANAMTAVAINVQGTNGGPYVLGCGIENLTLAAAGNAASSSNPAVNLQYATEPYMNRVRINQFGWSVNINSCLNPYIRQVFMVSSSAAPSTCYGLVLDGAPSTNQFGNNSPYVQECFSVFPSFAGATNAIGFYIKGTTAGSSIADTRIFDCEGDLCTIGLLVDGSGCSGVTSSNRPGYAMQDIFVRNFIADSTGQGIVIQNCESDFMGSRIDINGGWWSYTRGSGTGLVITASSGVLVRGFQFGGSGLAYQPITTTIATSLFNLTGVGSISNIVANAATVVWGLSSTTLPSAGANGVTGNGGVYYYKNITTNSFQLSATPGGAALTLGGSADSAVGVSPWNTGQVTTGILVQSASTDISVDGCLFNGNFSNCITVNNSYYLNIANCAMVPTTLAQTTATGAAIWLLNGASNVTLSSNVIRCKGGANSGVNGLLIASGVTGVSVSGGNIVPDGSITTRASVPTTSVSISNVTGLTGNFSGLILATLNYTGHSAGYTVAATTITALDTTNVTLPFTVPSTGIVDVEVEFSYSMNTTGGTNAGNIQVALLNHTGGALLDNAKNVGQQAGTATPFYVNHCRVNFHLTGLTPGAFQVDFAAGCTTSSDGFTIYAGTLTSTTVANNTQVSPLQMRAIASV